ncbi:MAG TPA: DUF2461 domain-containing protein [Solirubrobacteraceae bacterium]
MSEPDFQGFPPEAFRWFSGLENDNSKRYFEARRNIYDAAVRGPLEALLDELADELGGVVKMFRQNRDLRFSADKSPYKTTTYGVIGQRPGSSAPLYAQLSSGGLFAGTGYYRLDGEQLTRFRDAVVDERTGPPLVRAVAAVRGAGIETFGETLKTAPRGYPRDHPRIAMLRHRLLIAGLRLEPDHGGLSRDAVLGHVRRVWETAAPLNAWLDKYVGPGEGGRVQ